MTVTRQRLSEFFKSPPGFLSTSKAKELRVIKSKRNENDIPSKY